MTNLMRWLSYIGLLGVPYLAVVMGLIETPLVAKFMFEIQVLPIIIVIICGLYAATVVLYRTFTFNDCPEAEKELQHEINGARKDLISKGFKFRD